MRRFLVASIWVLAIVASGSALFMGLQATSDPEGTRQVEGTPIAAPPARPAPPAAPTPGPDRAGSAPTLVGALVDEQGEARYLLAIAGDQEALRIGETSASGYRLERADDDGVLLRRLADNQVFMAQAQGGPGSGALEDQPQGTPARGPSRLSHRGLRQRQRAAPSPQG